MTFPYATWSIFLSLELITILHFFLMFKENYNVSLPRIQRLSLPSLHICSVIPPSASGLWQLVHQQLLCTFYLERRSFSFSGVRGWPFFVPLENPAWTESRSTTQRAEITALRTISEIRLPGQTEHPRDTKVAWNQSANLLALPILAPVSTGRRATGSCRR